MDKFDQDAEFQPRSTVLLCVLGLCAALIFTGFVALGTWQVQRLYWKLDLIERVEARVHAPAVPAPGPDRWQQLNAEADEYRHVHMTGQFLYQYTTRVKASTRLGSGFWLLTPLRSTDGNIVLVNRGFVPEAPAQRNPQSLHNKTAEPNNDQSDAGQDTIVTGLLRMSEPGGAFLRHNDPGGNRWYSRDVSAMAAAHRLSHVAPYFIDADAAAERASSDQPVGGLTVISFHNNHLVYAITWYALALMVAGACFWVAREERRLRRGGDTCAGGRGRGNEGVSKN